MPALHDALATGVVSAGHVDAVARVAGQVEPAVRDALDRVRRQRWSTPRRRRRWTGSNATSATSPAGCPTTTGCGSANGSAGNGSCAAGPTARPGCATPTSRSIPKPTPGCRRRWTLPSLPSGRSAEGDESRTFDQLRADAFVTLVTAPRAGGRRPAEVSVLIDYDTLADGLAPPLGVRDLRRAARPTRDDPPARLRRHHRADRPRHPRRRARPGPGKEGRQRRSTPSAAGDVPHLRLPRLHRPLRRLRDPPRHRLDPTTRTDRPRQPVAVVLTASPRRPRRRLAPHPAPRPHHHPPPPRRHARPTTAPPSTSPRPESPTSTSSPSPTTGSRPSSLDETTRHEHPARRHNEAEPGATARPHPLQSLFDPRTQHRAGPRRPLRPSRTGPRRVRALASNA